MAILKQCIFFDNSSRLSILSTYFKYFSSTSEGALLLCNIFNTSSIGR